MPVLNRYRFFVLCDFDIRTRAKFLYTVGIILRSEVIARTNKQAPLKTSTSLRCYAGW